MPTGTVGAQGCDVVFKAFAPGSNSQKDGLIEEARLPLKKGVPPLQDRVEGPVVAQCPPGAVLR